VQDPDEDREKEAGVADLCSSTDSTTAGWGGGRCSEYTEMAGAGLTQNVPVSRETSVLSNVAISHR
jgi:hypothetical protein